MFASVKMSGAMKLTPAAAKKITRATMQVMGAEWHYRFYEGHFTAAGARKYHYGRRATKEVTTGTVKTTKTGRPRAPNGLPLVWSGETRQRGRMFRIVPTATGAKVVMPVNALNFKPPHNPGLNMAEELRKVLPSEKQELETAVQPQTEQWCQNPDTIPTGVQNRDSRGRFLKR